MSHVWWAPSRQPVFGMTRLKMKRPSSRNSEAEKGKRDLGVGQSSDCSSLLYTTASSW